MTSGAGQKEAITIPPERLVLGPMALSFLLFAALAPIFNQLK